MKTLYVLFALSFSVSTLSAQTILWDKSIGTSDTELPSAIISTADGGFLIGGSSAANAEYDKSQNNKNCFDYWVIKVDADGKKQWDQSYSGEGDAYDGCDYLTTLLSTDDGGYLIGGHSEGDIGFEKSENNRNDDDYWVIKIDANGNKIWDKTIGGLGSDRLQDMIKTDDGEFLLAGTSYDNNNLGPAFEQSVHQRDSGDYWVVKVDASGNKIWDKVYGGFGWEVFSQIIETSDGNFLLAGYSNSDQGFEKSSNSKGSLDYWIVKIDPNGNVIWDSTIGSDNYDQLKSVVLTSDGGYVLAGTSSGDQSFDKSETSRGGTDYWVVKIDANGNKLWDKTYGGSKSDKLSKVLLSPDDELILVGDSNSPKGFEKSQGIKNLDGKYREDYWILRTDLQGGIKEDYTIGGSHIDEAVSAVMVGHKGVAIVGQSFSQSGFDKSENKKGYTDFWVVKLTTAEILNVLVDIRDFVATCKPCWPWEIWWDFEYRFWDERYGLRSAVYRQAFSGRHHDEVYWEDEETLAIQLSPEGLAPGRYQLQIRALLEDGITTEWTEAVGFDVGGATTEIFPNPVGEVLSVHYYGQEESEEVILLLYNRFGEVLLEEERVANAGLNEWRLEMPRVSTEENPLSLQVISPSQGEQSWQLIRE